MPDRWVQARTLLSMKTHPDNKLLVRVDEAAARLGISRSKLYELMAAGHIAYVKIGRSVRIPTTALEEFVESLEAQVTSWRDVDLGTKPLQRPQETRRGRRDR